MKLPTGLVELVGSTCERLPVDREVGGADVELRVLALHAELSIRGRDASREVRAVAESREPAALAALRRGRLRRRCRECQIAERQCERGADPGQTHAGLGAIWCWFHQISNRFPSKPPLDPAECRVAMGRRLLSMGRKTTCPEAATSTMRHDSSMPWTPELMRPMRLGSPVTRSPELQGAGPSSGDASTSLHEYTPVGVCDAPRTTCSGGDRGVRAAAPTQGAAHLNWEVPCPLLPRSGWV